MKHVWQRSRCFTSLAIVSLLLPYAASQSNSLNAARRPFYDSTKQNDLLSLTHQKNPLSELSLSFTSHRSKRTMHETLQTPVQDQAPAAPWSSIAEPTPEQTARATEWATTAADMAFEAASDEAKIKKLLTKAEGSVPAAFTSVQHARKASQTAHEAELHIRAALKKIRRLAHDAAFDAERKVLGSIVKKAHDKEKKAAEERAKKLKSKLEDKAKQAAADAMQPYDDAMKRAAATAAEYAKRGGDLTSQSAALQMQAQLILGEANQWQSIGELAKAQGMMVQSRKMMELAASLNGQANTFYNTAKSITDTLPKYTAEASAAAYNAEVMFNPNAEPPPPPLVLFQTVGQTDAQ